MELFLEDIIDGLAGFEDILSQRYGIFVEDLLDEQSRSSPHWNSCPTSLRISATTSCVELFRTQNLTFWLTGDERPESSRIPWSNELELIGNEMSHISGSTTCPSTSPERCNMVNYSAADSDDETYLSRMWKDENNRDVGSLSHSKNHRRVVATATRPFRITAA